ncbi:hypothetical protein HDU86_005365 [Geranomyces michiganensis]|nr:hypothetical protein HDU86_005365 [Geranomyces michiganensis]
MLLFVHGFLGSESSFENFPLDLAERVRRSSSSSIEVRIFPRFDTKGDPTRAVNQLCNWLLLNAPLPEYRGVIVLAHSMGGLMAVDAYRKLYGIYNQDDDDDDEKEKAAAAAAAGNTPTTTQSNDQATPGQQPASTTTTITTTTSWLGAVGSWWSKKDSAAAAAAAATAATGGAAGAAGIQALASINSYSPTAASASASTGAGAAPPPPPPSTAEQQQQQPAVSANLASAEELKQPAASANPGSDEEQYEPAASAALEDLRNVAAEMEPELSGAPPTTDPTAVVSDALAQQPSLSLRKKAPPIRIIGIIAFDTPFFGLHTRVYTAAAGTRAAAVVSQYVPPLPPMPAAPAVPLFADAFSAIPEAVGHSVQAGSKAASDALRYGTRAVGSIPEAAHGIAAALPGAVAAMPGAATQGLHMGLQAVSALPGGALHLTSSALSSVSALPGGALHLGSSALSSVSALPGGALHLGSSALSTVAGLPAYWTTSKAVTAPPPADSEIATADEEKKTELSENKRNNITPPLPPRSDPPPTQDPPRRASSQDEMQDETVVFAAAVAAAAATVQESQQSSHNSTTPPASISDPSAPTTADLALLLPPQKLDTPGDASTASASAVGLHPIPQDSNWAPWVRLGLAGAAVAAGAYYSGGLVFAAPVVRRVAVAYALSHAEDARKHLQFLYPLWGAGAKVLARRLDDVAMEVGEGRLGFACFYAELPLPPVPDTSHQDAVEKSSSERLRTRLATLVGGTGSSRSNGNAMPVEAGATIITATTTTVDDTTRPPSGAAATAAAAAAPPPPLPARAAAATTPPPVVLNSPVAAAFATQLAAARAATTAASAASSQQSIPPPPIPPASASSTPTPTPTTTTTVPPRTFIALPPTTYAHMFRPVTIDDASDEIHAHMNMFTRDVNAAGYWGLVDRVAGEVMACLRKNREQRIV